MYHQSHEMEKTKVQFSPWARLCLIDCNWSVMDGKNIVDQILIIFNCYVHFLAQTLDSSVASIG